jgi:uncharacterized Zn finger protein
MTQIIFIHCRSCGLDCSASWAVPRHGHPVMRCGKCRSLNFRVIKIADVEEENPTEYERLAGAVQANVQEEETMEVSYGHEKSI